MGNDRPPPPPGASPAPEVAPARPAPAGRIILGLLILAIGVGWLLEALDVTDVPWTAIAPAALILLGAVLLWMPGPAHGGLIALGVVLSVIALAGSLFSITVEGGVGDRTIRPASEAELEGSYRHGIGKFTVDLSDAGPAAGREVEIRLGIGDLTVIVPETIDVEIEARASAGDVVIFGSEEGGLDVRRTFRSENVATGGGFLTLRLRVGLGRIEVRR